MRNNKWIWTAGIVLAVGLALGLGVAWLRPLGSMHGGAPHMMGQPSKSVGNIVTVIVPELSPKAQAGEGLFNENCARCHGANAAGQHGLAPPLVHKIYEPSHHSDQSFQRAAKVGVQAHHWPFGDMPAVPDVNEDDVTKIIAYVRALQRANGIN